MTEAIALSWHDSIEELPESSLFLFEHAEQQNIFLGFDWFKGLSRYVGSRLGRVVWIHLSIEGKSRALLPLLIKTENRLRIAHGLSNYYSPYFDIIAESNDHEICLNHIVQGSKAFFSDFDVIEFENLTPTTTKYFEAAFSADNYSSELYQATTNWRKKDIVDYETYLSGLPGNLRTIIKRKTKQIERIGSFSYKLFPIDDLQELLVDYHEVYYKSWKVIEPFPAFIDALASDAAGKNMLRLGILYCHSVPVAAQIWFVNNHTAYIYKLAYDPDYGKYSVGTLLSTFMFEWCIKHDAVTTIDYLTGNDEYKKDWMDEARILYGIKVFNKNTWRGRIGSLLNLVRRTRAGIHRVDKP